MNNLVKFIIRHLNFTGHPYCHTIRVILFICPWDSRRPGLTCIHVGVSGKMKSFLRDNLQTDTLSLSPSAYFFTLKSRAVRRGHCDLLVAVGSHLIDPYLWKQTARSLCCGAPACPRRYTSDPRVVAFVQNSSESDLRGHTVIEKLLRRVLPRGPLADHLVDRADPALGHKKPEKFSFNV